jgi:hypothetical protein
MAEQSHYGDLSDLRGGQYALRTLAAGADLATYEPKKRIARFPVNPL